MVQKYEVKSIESMEVLLSVLDILDILYYTLLTNTMESNYATLSCFTFTFRDS